MIRTTALLVLFALVARVGVAAAETVIINGVTTESSTQQPPVSVPGKMLPASELDEEFIDFDDMDVPGLFAEGWALTTEYEALGVVFTGAGEVLNESGNFSVGGYSAPNFLAFSTGAGVPGPETMLFDPPVDMVSIWAGHQSSGTISMDAYDEDGDLIEALSVAGVFNMQEMLIESDQLIASVVLNFSGSVCCFDNLTFEPDTTPPPVEFNLFGTTTVIPPSGGDLVYDVQLTSNIPATYPGIQYWTMVTLPNGQEFGPLMTIPFTLTPFMDVFITGASQTVPALAPAGTYTFMGYVGIPNVQFLEDNFEFEKIGTAAAGVEGWGHSFPANKASLR